MNPVYEIQNEFHENSTYFSHWLQSILLTCGAVVRALSRRKQRLEHALGSVWIRLETWWRTTGRRKRRRRLLPTPAGVLRKWLVWTEPPCRTSRTSGRNLFEEQPETRGLEIRISITIILKSGFFFNGLGADLSSRRLPLCWVLRENLRVFLPVFWVFSQIFIK